MRKNLKSEEQPESELNPASIQDSTPVESVPENLPKAKRDYLLPASILISALLISVSLVYSAGKKGAPPSDLAGNLNNALPTNSEIKLRAVSENDHYRGSLSAPVKMVEYSDLECPFCKQFHLTMQEVTKIYGSKVVWVYRHLPLDQLHPKARKEAEATECAAELGGNEKFWAYVDKLFEVTPSNNRLELEQLPEIASAVGLDRSKFESCLSSGRYADKISEDLKDAALAGGMGTPYTVVISKSGKKYPVSGALPLERLRATIDQALKN